VPQQALAEMLLMPASGDVWLGAAGAVETAKLTSGRRGVVVTRPIRSDQRSYCTPGPVNTAMGDCLWAGKPSRYVTNRLGQLSLSSLRGR